MKIEHLELENFGIHTEQSFAFSTDGLHIIYGRNEAGKSTLLQAVRQLLFGFQHAKSNPFAPDSSKKKMKATAKLISGESQLLEIVRRQGTKNTLSGEFEEGNATIDEERWQQLISGADQRLYEHVFGFSLKELATGEESLKEANLDEALFGGGLGRLHDYKLLLKNIDEETEALFKSRGQKQRINSILSDIKALKSELKDSSLRPVEYEQWLGEAQRCEEELTRLNTALAKVFRRQQHLERLKKAHPLWIDCQSKQQQLERMETPESFPAEALEELSQTRKTGTKLSAEVESLTQDLDRLDAEIAAISFNEALIESNEAIRSLMFGIKEMQGYRRDIPLRKQDRQHELDGATARLKQIGPKLKLDEVAQLELTLAQRKKIEQLTKTYQRLQTEIRSHAGEVDRLDQDIRELESALGDLPSQSSEMIEHLQAAIDPLRQSIDRISDMQRQLRKLQSDMGQRRVTIETIAGKELDFAAPLPMPLEQTIRRYEADFQAIAEQLRTAEQAARETTDELTSKNDELRRLEQSARLVSEEELKASRDQRDATWQTLRSVLEGTTQPETPTTSQDADRFEGEVQQSDELADQRHHHAQILADQQAMKGNIRLLEERLAQRQSYVAELIARRDELQQSWETEWQACGIVPKSPQEMLPWRTTFCALQETQTEISRLEEDLAPHQQRVEAATTLARTAGLPESTSSAADVAAWIASYLNRAQSERDRRQQLTSKLQLNQDARRQNFERNEKRQQELAGIEAEAKELLTVFASLGEVDLEMAAELIQTVEKIQGTLAAAESMQKRISDMEAGLAQFAEQVQSVVAATGEPLGEMAPEHAAQRLGTLLSEAENQLSLRKELEIKRQLRAETLEKSRKELADVEARLSQWRSQTNVETDDQLEVVSQTVRQRQLLESEIASLENRLALVRESEDAERFAAELEAIDVDTLQLDLSGAKTEYAETGKIQAEVNQQLGQLKLRLSEVDQTSRAVMAQGKIEALQAELSDCLDRLGPLLIAKEMLDRAMAAFREESSGQLLALISELIEQMTEGRYTQVEHDPDQEGGLILSGPNDLRRKPSELSTGTREQLYLAIRLAYIRHYCEQAEPLPVLMDDILVNFDDSRQLATLRVLMNFDPRIQIIMLTCHEPLVSKVQSLEESIRVTRMDGQPVEVPPPKAKPARKKSTTKSSTPSLF
ncbi:AAA family ATPase [Bremerella cremea]|uniref:AAA family ATPase n=1 Tax=Bremerella cremea TaxID=1031537 RepID=UPI0031E997AD